MKLTTNGAGPAYSGLIHPVKLGGRMRGECQGGSRTSQTQISLSLGVHWLPGCVLLRQESLLRASVGRYVPGGWGGAESPRR